jgi:hypothetical protein
MPDQALNSSLPPHREAGVAAATTNDGARLLVQHAQIGRGAIVAIAGQRKFLPDEDAKFVAMLEERGLVDSRAAPRPQ